jgi:hypothetical protein
MACLGREQRRAGSDPFTDPGLNLLLDPPNAAGRDLHPHGKTSFRLESIDLGSPETRHIPDLRKPEQPERGTAR